MTELHPEAVVCVGCGASKLRVRKKAGFLRGLGILGFSVLGILLLLPGRFMLGFGLLGVALLLANTLPYETKWVKSI
jgi:hypothetical protein